MEGVWLSKDFRHDILKWVCLGLRRQGSGTGGYWGKWSEQGRAQWTKEWTKCGGLELRASQKAKQPGEANRLQVSEALKQNTMEG